MTVRSEFGVCPLLLFLPTSLQHENPTLLTEHNHDGDESAIEAAKCKSRMETLAKITRDKPGQIYAQTALTMRTKRVYKNLQTRMKNLCQDRRDGRKSVEEFLHGAGHNIRWKS